MCSPTCSVTHSAPATLAPFCPSHTSFLPQAPCICSRLSQEHLLSDLCTARSSPCPRSWLKCHLRGTCPIACLRGSPGPCFLTLLNFLDSTSHYLELYLLVDVCLTLKTGSSLQTGTLLSCPHRVPSTCHRARRFAEWMASLPVSPILPVLSSLSLPVGLCLSPSVFLSPHSHFSLILSSVSHFHVSLWVCLSLSHPPSPSPAWPWHLEQFCPLATRKGTRNEPGWGPQQVSPTTPCPAPALP